MSNDLSIACLQYASTKDENKTLKIVERLMVEAVNLGAELIALPECATSLHQNSTFTKKFASYEKESISLNFFKKSAKFYSLYILVGSLPIKYKDKLVNRSFLIAPNGRVISKYDKIHLFDVKLPNGDIFRESDTYLNGKKAIIAKIREKNINVGMTICYDVRFPSLYQDLAENGAHIITVPSAFSMVTGQIHWHTLLKARAIETGCFIIAPAQNGIHECGRKSFGHSLIISPWGKILADGKDSDGLVFYKIDLRDVDKFRKSIPSLHSKIKYLTNF
jgi:predicted amidohydrolase